MAFWWDRVPVIHLPDSILSREKIPGKILRNRNELYENGVYRHSSSARARNGDLPFDDKVQCVKCDNTGSYYGCCKSSYNDETGWLITISTWEKDDIKLYGTHGMEEGDYICDKCEKRITDAFWDRVKERG